MATLTLLPAEAPYWPATPPGESRAERDLHVLLDLCRALQARLPVGESALRLLEALQKALPYGAGKVVLVEPGSGRVLRTEAIPTPAADGLSVACALEGRSLLEDHRLEAPLVVNRTSVGAVCVKPTLGRARPPASQLGLGLGCRHGGRHR